VLRHGDAKRIASFVGKDMYSNTIATPNETEIKVALKHDKAGEVTWVPLRLGCDGQLDLEWAPTSVQALQGYVRTGEPGKYILQREGICQDREIEVQGDVSIQVVRQFQLSLHPDSPTPDKAAVQAGMAASWWLEATDDSGNRLPIETSFEVTIQASDFSFKENYPVSTTSGRLQFDLPGGLGAGVYTLRAYSRNIAQFQIEAAALHSFQLRIAESSRDRTRVELYPADKHGNRTQVGRGEKFTLMLGLCFQGVPEERNAGLHLHVDLEPVGGHSSSLWGWLDHEHQVEKPGFVGSGTERVRVYSPKRVEVETEDGELSIIRLNDPNIVVCKTLYREAWSYLKCKATDCTKSADGKAGFCVSHGGGRYCSVAAA